MKTLKSIPTPFVVENALKLLGANIRTARVRRRITLKEMADKVGVSRQVIAAAESGKLTTGIHVYASILWTLGMLEQLEQLADPTLDKEGQILAMNRESKRARRPINRGPGGMSNDF